MKTLAFAGRRRMIAQGLQAALENRREPEFRMLPMILPQNIRLDATVYRPDILMIELSENEQPQQLLELFGTLRKEQPHCALVLLLAENDPGAQALSVQAKQSGLIDDFVFYDNSMQYLLAKLSAL